MNAAVLMALVLLEGQTPQHRRFMQPCLGRSVGAVFPANICLDCNAVSHTNYLTQSNDFTASPWVLANTGGAALPTIEISDGGLEFFDPAGGFTATKVNFGACLSATQQSQIYAAATTATGDVTANIYARSPTNGSFTIAAYTSSDNLGTASFSQLSTAWAPYYATKTAGSASNYIVAGCVNNVSYTGYSGAAASTVYLYGAQISTSSNPRCTLATGGSTATGTGSSPVCQSSFVTESYKSPIAWVGDSITYGYTTGPRLTTPAPAALAASIGRQVDNLGVPGDSAAQCLTHWRTSVRGHGYTSLILLCGVNSTPLTGPAVYATLETLLDEARLDGLHVTIVGLTPWANAGTWTAPYQTATDYINAHLITYASTYGINYVNTDSMGVGSPLALTAPNDSGDGIHPSQAGANALAALVAAANP